MSKLINLIVDKGKSISKKQLPEAGALPVPIKSKSEAKRNLPQEVHEHLSRKDFEMLTKGVDKVLDKYDTFYITDTRLSLFGSKEIKQLAVCECTKPNNKIDNREIAYDPTPGTVDDLKMGTLSRGLSCLTCNQNSITCPGHIGYINLFHPVINPLFRKVLIYIMNIFCEECNEPLFIDRTKITPGMPDSVAIDPLFYELASLGALERLKFLSDKYSKKGNPHPKHVKNPRYINELSSQMKSAFAKSGEREEKYQTDLERRIKFLSKSEHIEQPEAKDLRYTIFRDDGMGSDVSIEFIRKRLNSINNYFLKMLDINNIISSIIIDCLVVIPPVARTYGMLNGEMIINPITLKYSNIISTNIQLQKRNPNTPDFTALMAQLYSQITQLYDLIQTEVKGKTGIIRGLSMGKRVDYSGRSVLNPSNSLSFGWIGCPNKMKKYHTKSIRICDYNRKECLRLYYDRKVPYIVINSDPRYRGNRLVVTEKMLDEYEPQNKDDIEVEGMDGDEILFNRQPTLHKQGMMGHKVIYSNSSCIELLSSYTTPYNADFDGDEGNVHKLQTIDARAEARYFANVGACIMNSQSNKPIMGLVYNTLVSAYLLTNDNTIVDPDIFNYIIILLSTAGTVGINFRERLQKANAVIDEINNKETQKLNYVNEYSGKSLFSLLFPEDFYYNSGDVRIRHGILISGRITKKQIGTSAGAIVHHLWKIYGRERTMLFLTQGQWLLDEYIEKRGFTVGLSSCTAKTVEQEIKTRDIVNSELYKTQLKIEVLGPVTPEMTYNEKEHHENEIKSYLNIVKRIGTRVGLEALDEKNSLNVMSMSGAKGNETNIAQIMVCLGQQYIKDSRPKPNITKSSRTLPYFRPHSNNIEAHGFVKESFMQGIKPTSMIFHMMASRIGIMDTALKTADTGHMHHRLNKTLEDFVYDYNGSVRNMNGTIFQYNYSDGFNAGDLIPTQSNSLGEVISFIDLKSIIGKLNSEAGFEVV